MWYGLGWLSGEENWRMFKVSMMVICALANLGIAVRGLHDGDIPSAFTFSGFAFGYAGLAITFAT